MSAREHLAQIIARLPETQLELLREYADKLESGEMTPDEERRLYKVAGMRNFAKCFGPNEPEYTLADVKRKV